MCSEILCYLSKDACSVGVLDAQKPPGQESAKHPGQDLFTKLEEKQQTKICVCLASVTSFLQTPLEILFSGLGLNTVK